MAGRSIEPLHLPKGIAATGLVLVLALGSLRRHRTHLRDLFESHPGWIVLGFATALLLPIMVAVKRLWGFYLFPGQLFAILAMASIVEQWLVFDEPSPQWRAIRKFATSALIGFALVACFHGGKAALHEYNRLAHRTGEPQYLQNLAVYQSSVSTLASLARETTKQKGGALEVLYDPFLFLPDSQPNLSIQVFWAATINWDFQPSAIVLGRQWHLSYFLREKQLPPSTSANFAPLNAAVEQFAIHVETDPSATSTKPYQLVQWFGNDAALILRKDLVGFWRNLPPAQSDTSAKK